MDHIVQTGKSSVLLFAASEIERLRTTAKSLKCVPVGLALTAAQT